MTDQNQVNSVNSHLQNETNEVKPTADLKKEEYGWLEVDHGIAEDKDYVWHFSNHHPQRRIPDDQQKTIEIIASYLSKTIPESVEVECFPSPSDWEKKVITVKAKGIVEKWNFDEQEMTKYLPKIGELVSKEIEKHVKRRRFL